MIFRWFRITCRQAHVLLSERLDRSLRPLEVVRLRLHLTVCDMCSVVARQFRYLSDAVRRIGS
jgi:predicted anti-sigma-YlaC factor YlaD